MATTLTLVFALLPVVFGSSTPGFRVRHKEDNGTYTFPALPQTMRQAEEMGWAGCERAPVPPQYESLTAMCWNDSRGISVLFDCNKDVAGLHINLNQNYLTNAVFDMEVEGFVNWTTSYKDEQVNFWTTGMYFLKDASHVQPRRKNSKTLLRDGNLYVNGINGPIYEISSDVSKNTDFTVQKCVATLGTHSFYNMTSELECKAENLLTTFYLTNGTEFIGWGFYVTGVLNVPEGEYNWLEKWGVPDAEESVSDGPDCFLALGSTSGWTGLKVFEIDNPEDTTC